MTLLLAVLVAGAIHIQTSAGSPGPPPMHICGPFIGSEPPCATAPVPDRVVWPAYTEQARAAEVEGYVDLSLVIDETGKPHDIQIIRSLGDGLDENAVAALQQWTFKPATYEGR